VIVIGGGAGVGKTTLAVHWAHRVKERFPDGQLYLNLRGFGPGAKTTTPEEAVRGLLEGLGVPGTRMPASAEGKFGLYRSLVAGKRLLVLLDNVREADQVRPLLPGSPDCVTVVTSRDQMPSLVAADGAYPVALGLPSEDEAKEIFVRRLGQDREGAEPETMEQIVGLCARLPLALAIVAARAATNPGFSLAALAEELRAARGGLDAFDIGDPVMDVRAVFSWSYLTLSPAAARLFRLLGLHPEPHFTSSAAASLLGVAVRQVRPLLAELARAQLIAEHSPGRYGFHDLLRAYASELLGTEDSGPARRAAIRRMLDHYLHTAMRAARFLRCERGTIELGPPPRGVVVEALTEADSACWFGSAYPVLLALIDQAAGAGFDDHARQLAFALTSTYSDGGVRRFGDPGAYRTAIEAARSLDDSRTVASGDRGLSMRYLTLGSEEAEEKLGRALRLFEAAGDRVR
jgi:hypothetical protein